MIFSPGLYVIRLSHKESFCRLPEHDEKPSYIIFHLLSPGAGESSEDTMPCPICKLAHETQKCMTFVTATQPLKDLINQIYDKLPAIVRDGEFNQTWEAIYYSFYSPTNLHLPAREYGWTWWERPALRHASREERGRMLARIRERVYLNLNPDRLEDVWNILVREVFPAEPRVMEAKRCSGLLVARNRHDSVVIYLTSNGGTQRILNRLRSLIQMGPLQVTDFRNQTPPGTGRVGDLPGVAVGIEPDSDGRESFGTQLSKALAEVWEKRCRIGQIPRWDFMGYALRHLLDQGIEIKRPWQVSLAGAAQGNPPRH